MPDRIIETGKKLIVAGETTEYISGDDSHATVLMEGAPTTGKIYLEAFVERQLPLPGEINAQGSSITGRYGLPDATIKQVASESESMTIVVDTFTEEGASVVDLNEGILYRFRASTDFTGEVTIYMSAGNKYRSQQ